MNEDWYFQDTIQGVDEAGRSRMLNIRAKTYDEFEKVYAQFQPHFKTWKPMPIKSYGTGKPPQAARELKSLADVPECPVHKIKMIVRPYTKDGNTMYFWSCQERNESGYCKERIAEKPTQATFEQWQKLVAATKAGNGHTPAPAATPGKASAGAAEQASANGAAAQPAAVNWLKRGKLILALKKIPLFNDDPIQITAALDKYLAAKVIAIAMTDEEIEVILNKRASIAADKQTAGGK